MALAGGRIHDQDRPLTQALLTHRSVGTVMEAQA
jgi:hypothetical protein